METTIRLTNAQLNKAVRAFLKTQGYKGRVDNIIYYGDESGDATGPGERGCAVVTMGEKSELDKKIDNIKGRSKK